jgi:hypothetical protein
MNPVSITALYVDPTVPIRVGVQLVRERTENTEEDWLVGTIFGRFLVHNNIPGPPRTVANNRMAVEKAILFSKEYTKKIKNNL